MDLFRSRANDLAGYTSVNAVPLPGLEGFFHAAIFTRMKGQDSHATTGFEAEWEIAQKCFQGAEFVVDRDAQGLKNPANTSFHLLP